METSGVKQRVSISQEVAVVAAAATSLPAFNAHNACPTFSHVSTKKIVCTSTFMPFLLHHSSKVYNVCLSYFVSCLPNISVYIFTIVFSVGDICTPISPQYLTFSKLKFELLQLLFWLCYLLRLFLAAVLPWLVAASPCDLWPHLPQLGPCSSIAPGYIISGNSHLAVLSLATLGLPLSTISPASPTAVSFHSHVSRFTRCCNR